MLMCEINGLNVLYTKLRSVAVSPKCDPWGITTGTPNSAGYCPVIRCKLPRNLSDITSFQKTQTGFFFALHFREIDFSSLTD